MPKELLRQFSLSTYTCTYILIVLNSSSACDVMRYDSDSFR